jgi:hypothetical protein
VDVAALVALGFSHEQTNMFRRSFDCEVTCEEAGASFRAAEKFVVDAHVRLGNGWLHVGRAGPTRGPAVVTKEVRGVRWRPAKAPAMPADRH